MSTFNGKVAEIPDISVDRFDGANTLSTVYFLSHCHTDHMIGLSDWKFQDDLVARPDVFLYASSISLNILKNKFPNIQSKLRELPIDSPTLIKFPNDSNRTLLVTVIPAGHCPGSVMFLFETDKNILYTGDYRVQVSDLKKIKAFYSVGRVKTIHKMYLDTTFFNPMFSTFPSREKAAEVICKVIKEWIAKSEKHIVDIKISARYGSEYLFVEIARNLGSPIHVNWNEYNTYICVPELDECVTLHGTDTKLHASCLGRTHCITDDSYSVLTIKPSALYWKNNDFSSGIYTMHYKLMRVCYSCHPSFEETKEFLLFLKPLEIEPCVVPDDPLYGNKEQLYAELGAILNSYSQSSPICDEESNKVDDINNFQCATPGDVPEILSEMLGSPPKTFKRKRFWLGDSDISI